MLLATLLVSLASRTAPQSVVPCITFNEAQTPGTVTIGVLTAVGLFDSISSSVRIMADMINNDHTILPNTTLRIVVYNTNLEPSVRAARASLVPCRTVGDAAVMIDILTRALMSAAGAIVLHQGRDRIAWRRDLHWPADLGRVDRRLGRIERRHLPVRATSS